MKLLALATGLLLLAIATGAGPEIGHPRLDSRVWLRLLESRPAESHLVARGRPLGSLTARQEIPAE